MAYRDKSANADDSQGHLAKPDETLGFYRVLPQSGSKTRAADFAGARKLAVQGKNPGKFRKKAPESSDFLTELYLV